MRGLEVAVPQRVPGVTPEGEARSGRIGRVPGALLFVGRLKHLPLTSYTTLFQ